MARCGKCQGYGATYPYGGLLLHKYCYEQVVRPCQNAYVYTKKLTPQEIQSRENTILKLKTEIMRLENEIKDSQTNFPEGKTERFKYMDGRETFK